MEPGDLRKKTAVTEFILHGLTENIGLQSILFAVFFFAYIVTVGGNFSTLAAVIVEPRLHTPMYYFLGILCLLDIGCIMVTVPPKLVGVLAHQCRVPYAASMAYDCYLAICQPLTYSTCMNCEVQGDLVGTCCTVSFLNALTHTVAVTVLDFYGPDVINNFYCDLPPLFQLSCSSIHHNGQLLFVGATFMGVIPMILISVSYAHVAAALLRIRSAEGRKKAFSSCGSQLTVVCIFYATGFFSYVHLDKDKGIEILNTVISPMLNPIIYSLQNPDVQGTLKGVFPKKKPPL
uniref:G-protein coupled receptors family 1 profile domain-containing protein n=1 Tax=Cavia porcellus TaxID=10141 RepID=H0VEV5_CAVPO